ncbi:hypothetical protein Elgi_38170 [Paenibacillus elgii]|nr:hypothetical protein Elgi_38170 [Paenibacillus elgii]
MSIQGRPLSLKERVYKAYYKDIPDSYERITALVFKNEFGKRHMIGNNPFFNEHFREIQ